ncbi:putative 50 kda protein in type i retrotransposable element r1dm [Lasius niger]|uniref:Putative 50 kDa protein in type i retrotransposable element r1dm n=1 Tax=Lasius niger TaxID=67767 RepID=A0A0J7KYM4_LASNI|nr:putative 50 kda protein in type i retrotransposable element r1dm [Lasius niger]
MRRTPNGMGIVWVRCPLMAANLIMERTQIKVGWAFAWVELLANRPLQCYKCLEGGHVRARCPNKEDRSGKCYRCGKDGHEAKNCEAAVKYSVCSDRNLPANHRTRERPACRCEKAKGESSYKRCWMVSQSRIEPQLLRRRKEHERQRRQEERRETHLRMQLLGNYGSTQREENTTDA